MIFPVGETFKTFLFRFFVFADRAINIAREDGGATHRASAGPRANPQQLAGSARPRRTFPAARC